MTLYLPDTNIVSLLDRRRHRHAPQLIACLKRNGASLFLSVMTITELDLGVLKLRRERKIKGADQLARLVTAMLSDFGDRLLAIDLEIARQIARLASTYRQPLALPDLIIVATAARHGLTVLTHNTGQFGRLPVTAHDPLIELPPDA